MCLCSSGRRDISGVGPSGLKAHFRERGFISTEKDASGAASQEPSNSVGREGGRSSWRERLCEELEARSIMAAALDLVNFCISYFPVVIECLGKYQLRGEKGLFSTYGSRGLESTMAGKAWQSSEKHGSRSRKRLITFSSTHRKQQRQRTGSGMKV